MDNAEQPDTEDHPIARAHEGAFMVITKNVARGEGIFRIVLGIMLILSGFFPGGFWMLLSIVIGGLLVLTGIVGY